MSLLYGQYRDASFAPGPARFESRHVQCDRNDFGPKFATLEVPHVDERVSASTQTQRLSPRFTETEVDKQAEFWGEKHKSLLKREVANVIEMDCNARTYICWMLAEVRRLLETCRSQGSGPRKSDDELLAFLRGR